MKVVSKSTLQKGVINNFPIIYIFKKTLKKLMPRLKKTLKHIFTHRVNRKFHNTFQKNLVFFHNVWKRRATTKSSLCFHSDCKSFFFLFVLNKGRPHFLKHVVQVFIYMEQEENFQNVFQLYFGNRNFFFLYLKYFIQYFNS